RPQLTDATNEALSRRPSWWSRLRAWVVARLGGADATNGYWGGVTFWDRVKAAAATLFLKR
ncbi:MAG: hypothetical protein HOU01_14510, partial [Streptomycetaceae bacterium]|nr:hypothetical protein [Streptomycetaceae bacterium]